MVNKDLPSNMSLNLQTKVGQILEITESPECIHQVGQPKDRLVNIFGETKEKQHTERNNENDSRE